MSHTCHARSCQIQVPPTKLMCLWHWRKVPHAVQQAVYATYRRGQCDDKRPSREWHRAASAAIGFVARLEKKAFSLNEAIAMEHFGLADETMKTYLARMREAGKTP